MKAILLFMTIMVLISGARCDTHGRVTPMEPVNLVPVMTKLTLELPTLVVPLMQRFGFNDHGDELMSHDDEFLNWSSVEFKDIFNNTTKNWTVAA